MNAKLRKDQLQKEIKHKGDLYPVMQSILLREHKMRRATEHFWVASLNAKSRLLNVELINIGAANRVGVQPPEVFRLAIYKAAVSIIMVHNHPSGVLKASHEDKNLTDRMMKVGKLLNIKVEDHLIISETDCYSMGEAGILNELRKSGLYEVTLKETEDMKKWREEELKKKTREEKAREMALRSLEYGLSVEVVANLTGLRKSSVEKMKREMGR
jgi:DNA repair protein RadC